LCQNLTTFYLVVADTTQQNTNVVPGFTKVQRLVEHFNTRNSRLQDFVLQTNDFNFVADLNGTTVNTTGNNSTTTSDSENVFDWQHEWLVSRTLWSWDVFVDNIHQVQDNLFLFRVTFQSLQSRTTNNWNVIAREIVFAQQVANFHFNQVNQFVVINQVSLVQEYNDVLNTNLTSQQNVFTSLWHRTVSSSNNQDSTIHLCGTSDHVLNVVGVARGIDVCVVTRFRFVFNVGRVDSDTTFLFFWSVVDISVVFSLCQTLFCQNLRDSSSQSSLTMVNVANSTNVYMGFSTFIMFFFSH